MLQRQTRLQRWKAFSRAIKFEHSIFALPFALGGAWLGAHGWPPWGDLALIVLAAVCARTAAMGLNRVVDRSYDATNKRTATRELVTGELEAGWTLRVVFGASVAFCLCSFALAPICGWLSLPTLGVLFGYSYLKRCTAWCHVGLGLALACAPCGAWLAIRKEFDPDWVIPAQIGGGVLAWVFGFDLLYSLQDLEHDRREGLHSVPVRWGERGTRLLALIAHLVALFAWAGLANAFGWGPYAFGLFLIAGLLLAEHYLVSDGRVDRIPLVFFTINAWVGPLWLIALLFEGPDQLAILERP
ncbi:MAG: putative 4-hydroxybenzoate polyprenyltransferase [Planctomycetes bacterium]|nr:putative 4-hydroxybenzoate polyprenyltransferase [Planctomycetota bacterium]